MNDCRIIALIDPIWRGHSPEYFANYWELLSRLPGIKVVGFCPEAEMARAYLAGRGIQQPEIWGLSAEPLTDAKFSEAQKITFRWRRLGLALKQAEADGEIRISLAFIIWLEPFLGRYVSGRVVDRAFPFSWVGLYLHPHNFRLKPSRRFWLRDRLFPVHAPLLARNCKATLTLDEGIVDAMSRDISKPVLWMPDITNSTLGGPDSEIARHIRSKAANRMVCGLFGVLQKRKGILPLISVAVTRPPGWFFVFAGEIQKTDFSRDELHQLEQFMKSEPDNCLFWTRKIPDGAGFNAAMVECDVIYAAYETFPHSSNIMTKAALFKKPIIVSPGFLMAERVLAFRLGWILPANSNEAVRDIFAGLNLEKVEAVRDRAMFNEYVEAHSHRRLGEAFNQMLELVT